MSTEDKLKDLILSRYKSIREFTIAVDLPYSTLDSIFRRGVANSSVTNINKICKALKISADELANGRIVPYDYKADKTTIEYTDIADIVEQAKDRIAKYATSLDGHKINKDTIDTILNAIDVGVEVAKRNNKKE